jgi:hypothetical protein
MVRRGSWLLITGRLIFLGILHVSESKQDSSAKEEADFKTILSHLNATYCGNIAYEFMHLPVSSTFMCRIRRLIIFSRLVVCQRTTLVVPCCGILEQTSTIGG